MGRGEERDLLNVENRANALPVGTGVGNESVRGWGA